LGRGEIEESEKILTQTIQLDPNAPEGHYYLGLALDRQGRQTAAAASFKQALALGEWAEMEDAQARVSAYESSSPVSQNGTETE